MILAHCDVQFQKQTSNFSYVMTPDELHITCSLQMGGGVSPATVLHHSSPNKASRVRVKKAMITFAHTSCNANILHLSLCSVLKIYCTCSVVSFNLVCGLLYLQRRGVSQVWVGFELVGRFVEGLDKVRAELAPLKLHSEVSLAYAPVGKGSTETTEQVKYRQVSKIMCR